MNRKQMIQEKRDALKQIPKRELIDRICNYPDQQSLNRDADGNWRDHPVGQMAHQIRDKQNYQMSEKQYYSLIHHYAALTIPELRVVGVTHRENDPFDFERTVVGHDKNTTTYDMQYHLKPEPENPYDKHAVAVYVEKRDGSEHQIGYVGRKFLEVHPITEEQTVDGTMIDFSNGRLNNVSYRFPIDTEVLEARRQVVQQELPVDVQYGDKYVYERRFALSPQSRVTDREQLQTWWKQQDTQSNGSSYLTKAVNDELSFYKTAGAEQVDSAEFVFTNGREGVIRLISESELSDKALLTANSYLNYLQEEAIGAEMKECPYVQIPLTADSFVNIHGNRFEQVAAPVAEKAVETDFVQTETSIPDINSYEQMTLDAYLSGQQEAKPMLYQTNFKLAYPVRDMDAAKAYLSEDDMTEILVMHHPELDGVVSNIEWILDDDESGHIDLETTRSLTDVELTMISEWVAGQNADGLGEGFEQQPFATYSVEEDPYGLEEDEWVMASFDWKSNSYAFSPVESDLVPPALTDTDLQFDTPQTEQSHSGGKVYQAVFYMDDLLAEEDRLYSDDEMTEKLHEQIRASGLSQDVVAGTWMFLDENEGIVNLISNRVLQAEELNQIGDWAIQQDVGMSLDIGRWSEHDLSEKAFRMHARTNQTNPNQMPPTLTEADLQGLADENYLCQ